MSSNRTYFNEKVTLTDHRRLLRDLLGDLPFSNDPNDKNEGHLHSSFHKAFRESVNTSKEVAWMGNRPTELTVSRIMGLDLSKKAQIGCSHSNEEGFQEKKHFDGLMNEKGRTHLASMIGKGDVVFLEGGSSSPWNRSRLRGQ